MTIKIFRIHWKEFESTCFLNQSVSQQRGWWRSKFPSNPTVSGWRVYWKKFPSTDRLSPTSSRFDTSFNSLRPLSVWFLFRTSGNTVKQARLPPPKCMAWISGWGIFPNYLMPENNHRNDWIPNLFGGPNEAGKYEMTISLFHPESQKLTESLLAPLSAVLL